MRQGDLQGSRLTGGGAHHVDPALRLMIDEIHRYDGYIVQSKAVMIE